MWISEKGVWKSFPKSYTPNCNNFMKDHCFLTRISELRYHQWRSYKSNIGRGTLWSKDLFPGQPQQDNTNLWNSILPQKFMMHTFYKRQKYLKWTQMLNTVIIRLFGIHFLIDLDRFLWMTFFYKDSKIRFQGFIELENRVSRHSVNLSREL